MFSTGTSIPDYNVYEYLLVLSPTGEACQQIWSVKHDVRKAVNAPFAVRTGPHLTMIVFLAYAKNEQKIIECLQRICAGIIPFNVIFQDFGYFEASGTLYINVVTKDAILNVLEELKQARYRLKLAAGYPPKFTYHPHVSICRGMNDWQYTVSWSKYATQPFNQNFIVQNMTLLKRTPGEHTCKTVGQFPFLSTPIMLKQGKLFM